MAYYLNNEAQGCCPTVNCFQSVFSINHFIDENAHHHHVEYDDWDYSSLQVAAPAEIVVVVGGGVARDLEDALAPRVLEVDHVAGSRLEGDHTGRT